MRLHTHITYKSVFVKYMHVMTYVFFALFQIRQMDRTQMMSYIAVIISVKWIQHENLERYNDILYVDQPTW